MTRFVKAHACGNDFLVVEGKCDPELAKKLCARNTGVGADGVEFLEWTGSLSGTIRLANADGSIAEISGNGTRCVAAWMAHQANAAPGDVVTLETDAGVRACRMVSTAESHYEIAAGMGVPVVHAEKVTLADGTVVEGTVVSMGNPHFVILVEGEEFQAHGRSWQALGQEICFHLQFPQQTNVEFVRILDTKEIAIRIFERGVGPTTSSGTGTCACAATVIARYGGAPHLLVDAPGGRQHVEWAGEGREMTLTGPADLIATGEAFGG
ncbi:diaminopimelate epimerase [Paracidobacterium acidisoli]|uniref:Diaminopimelate epimerase n=1 Tax=Paracidobacterium acidisoli TaxID=2303751 RepID=A0A372IK79_9BACT|nr:diaminopimelate epimerase [Paracidobacterium acidisoli]MBT9333055.1 diaminopimelate epimerase [Paracidobacterium acidisoli]